MAAYFIDLDGTLLVHGENHPLEGAVEAVKRIRAAGHQVIITTKRGLHSGEGRKQDTIAALKRHGFEYDDILFGITSPRIVVNDRGCATIQHPKDDAWKINPLDCLEGLDAGS